MTKQEFDLKYRGEKELADMGYVLKKWNTILDKK